MLSSESSPGASLTSERTEPEEFREAGRGLLALVKKRIDALTAGSPSWGQSPGRTVLGYRSAVDGSHQPYALTLPANYEHKAAAAARSISNCMDAATT